MKWHLFGACPIAPREPRYWRRALSLLARARLVLHESRVADPRGHETGAGRLFIVLAAVLLLTTPGEVRGRTVEISNPLFDDQPTENPDSTVIDNPYWPLPAGSSFAYRAVTAEECEFNQMLVSDVAFSVAGVWTRVIRDQAWVTELDDEDQCDLENALLVEDTLDYYAQDAEGNIWYFGEDTCARGEEPEEDSSEGSWLAGVDGAQPGIVMLAEPRPGDRYRQEYLAGEAEDWAAVLRLNASISIDAGEFAACLVTKEWTPLEHGEVEHKYYCPENDPSGLIFIQELKGRTARVEYLGETVPGELPDIANGVETYPAGGLDCPPPEFLPL